MRLAAKLIVHILASSSALALSGPDCGDWMVVSSPNPAQGNNVLVDLAVAAPNNVFLLGDSGGSPFVEHWDGTSFSESVLPDLSGAAPAGAKLQAVAAIGGQVWVAGIATQSDASIRQIFLRYQSGSWNLIDTLALLPQIDFPFLPRYGTVYGIGAVTEDDIWVVGQSSGFQISPSAALFAIQPMTLHWDGIAWTELLTDQIGNRDNYLFGIDMLSANEGWAVGCARDTFHAPFGTIYRWDGESWDPVSTPVENLENSTLNDVVAIASNDVWVCGSHEGTPIFAHFDGNAWTVQHIEASVPSTITSITAITSDDIWAVSSGEGGYFHFDGNDWTEVGAPILPGLFTANRGAGIVAAGPCDVWSVGSWSDGLTVSTLVERLRSACTGDIADDFGTLNGGDGMVSFGDFLALLGLVGPCPGGTPGCTGDIADDFGILGGDGMVSFGDFLALLGLVGPCP